MSKLLIIDGGTRTLELEQATVGYLRRPETRDNRRIETVDIYIDDVSRQERLVLKVRHTSTLAGNKPRGSMDEVTLYTIIGYNPERNSWGPEERRADLEISWENGDRLVREITEHVQANFSQFDGGTTWYAKNRHYL